MFCFFTLKIENTKGEVFELTHNTKDYVVAGIQGLTRPPTSVNTSACAGIDGSFFNSARMEQRNIVLDLILRGDVEGNRQKLYHIFPAKTPCTVYFKNYNRDVKIKGYVETLEGDIFSVREQMQISIICPKPFWEDMQAVYDELSSIVKRFSFPFSIEEPIPIAELNGSGGVTIENKGDVETGFICRVTMQTKKIPTLTRNTYSDPLPEEVRKRYAYIPLTAEEYNPETDTLYFTSTVQPSNSSSDRYTTINGIRYLERIYKTDQTGAKKTIEIIRAEGCAAKDLLYFEYTFTSSTWAENTDFTVSNPGRIPYDAGTSYVDVRGKTGDTLADAPLSPDQYTLEVGENIVIKLTQNLSDRGYTGLRIILVSSKSGIDVSGATGIRRLVKDYQWFKEISWYPCDFENYDREKDLLNVYDGGELRTDYSIETLTYEDGGESDFIIFNSPIKGDISYNIVKSRSGEDVRHISDRDIDAGLLLVDHLKIINHTTGQAFGLDYPFQVGDEITINTLSGELSVTLNRGGTVINLLRYLSGDSTWIKLASGSNYLTFSADPNSDFVYAVFRTAILYGGV